MTWNSETNIKGPKGDKGDPGASGTGTGNVVGPTPPVVDNRIATWSGTSGTVLKDSGKLITDLAPVNNPVLTGDPQAPTPAVSDNDTSIATTAFVKAQNYAASSAVPIPATATPLVESGTGAVGTGVKYAREDHVHPLGPGGSSQAGEWTYNTTLTFPPASGQVRLNNASQSAATHVYIHGTTVTGIDTSNYLNVAVVPSSKIYIQDKNTAANYALYLVTAVTQTSGNIDATVTYSQGGGTLPAGQRVMLSVIASSSGGGSTVYANDNPPAGAPDNSLWVETDTGMLFFRYNDGNSTQWVSIPLAVPAGTVRYDAVQTLTAPQQAVARANIAATGNLLNTLQYAASGTYTPSNSNVKFIVAELWGGGGGSGNAPATSAGQISTGGGGGSGAYARKTITGPVVQAFTVGGGGAAITAGAATIFGSVTAGGGGAGNPGTSGATCNMGGGSGGTASGGDLNLTGATGTWGLGVASFPYILPGVGGTAPRGGSGGSSTGTPSSAGGFPGGGGSAGYSYGGGAGTAVTGGAGAGGCIIIYEYA